MFGSQRDFLAVQWFRLCSRCGGCGVHPWSGNQIPHAEHHSQEKVWEPDTCQTVFSMGGLQDGQDVLSGERQLVGKKVCGSRSRWMLRRTIIQRKGLPLIGRKDLLVGAVGAPSVKR